MRLNLQPYPVLPIHECFLRGVTFKAIAAKTTKTEPTQSIGVITSPKQITEPIVAEKGSKASSKLTVDALI